MLVTRMCHHDICLMELAGNMLNINFIIIILLLLYNNIILLLLFYYYFKAVFFKNNLNSITNNISITLLIWSSQNTNNKNERVT